MHATHWRVAYSLRTTNSCVITRQDTQYSLLAATYSSAFSGSRSLSASSPSSQPSTDIQERPERVFQSSSDDRPTTCATISKSTGYHNRRPSPNTDDTQRPRTWSDALNQVFFKTSIAAVCIVGSRTSTRVQVMRVTSLSGFCRQ